MTQTQEIPWKRLAAEGLVVVVSILLAFSIDAWWDRYKEGKREQSQLVAMREEFSESLVNLDEVLEAIQLHVEGVEELMAMLQGSDAVEIEVPAVLLGYAIGWRTSNVSTSTLDALIASGDLNLLDNEELRKDLAGLPAELLDLTEDELMAMEYAESVMSSFMARNGYAQAAYANRPEFEWPDAPKSVIVTPSSEFLGLLMARRVHFGFSLLGMSLIKEYLEGLIEQIDNELAQ